MTLPDVGWFTPHQDDELLTGGRTLRALEEAGHRVWTILMTLGQNSGARPATGLSLEEFGRARDDEYRRATRRVGVHPDRILISPLRAMDGQLTVPAAEVIIADWMTDHPGAWVKTTTNLGAHGVQHEDHRAAGQAAVNLLRAGALDPNTLRLGVEQYQLAEFKAANPGVKLIIDQAGSAGIVQAALDVYGENDGVGWKFGIGHKSVGPAFKLVRGNPVSYYHVPVL